jgi:hypothetical protein
MFTLNSTTVSLFLTNLFCQGSIFLAGPSAIRTGILRERARHTGKAAALSGSRKTLIKNAKSDQKSEVLRGWCEDRRRGGMLAQDEYERRGKESKRRVARLTALLHEFELHLRNDEVERARDRLAAITSTLAIALTDAQKRVVSAG